MLGSITPLGERGRGSRWWLTVTVYLVSSTLGGVAIGAALGLVGSWIAGGVPVTVRLAVIAAAVIAGSLADLGPFGLRLPTVRRQVDEEWRTAYRGWVDPGGEARGWGPDAAPPAVPGAVVRLANFPLPVTKNTYAAEVADDLRPGDVLVSLVELDPALADRGLYAGQGVPRVRADDLDARALQAAGPGWLGVQRFFSLHGRAFSLYVMAREGPGLEHSLRAMNASLRS